MEKHLQDLKEIRLLMERSTKFLSLSGLSGIAVGVVALIAAFIVYSENIWHPINETVMATDHVSFLVSLALATFLCALLVGFIFTKRKANKIGEKVWNKLSQKLLIHLGIPLLVGGLFAFALLVKGVIWPLAGLTLVFYGLALINGSQFTFREIYYLGVCEIILGIIALFWVGYSLLFWAIGFGVLHIIYGARMYNKYDK